MIVPEVEPETELVHPTPQNYHYETATGSASASGKATKIKIIKTFLISLSQSLFLLFLF